MPTTKQIRMARKYRQGGVIDFDAEPESLPYDWRECVKSYTFMDGKHIFELTDGRLVTIKPRRDRIVRNGILNMNCVIFPTKNFTPFECNCCMKV